MTESEDHALEPRHWMERYGDYLFNFAMVRVNDREKAEDLVQETFLAALKGKDRFRGKSSERTWLTSILKRKVVDFFRKQYRSRESSLDAFETEVGDGDFYRAQDPFKGHWLDGKGPHSYSLLPEGEMEQEELARFIQHCIERLPPQLGAAFILKMVDEEDSEFICKELGITPSNLWVMLHRARLRMRECLEQSWLK